MAPVVSVVTAVLNRAATLAQALASVQAQQGVRVEHIVIDGGSTDGSLELLRAQGERIAVLVSEPDAGIYHALNKGLARATGDIVGFLHSDDVYAHERVLARVGAAFADPAVEAAYGDLDYVTPDAARVLRRWRAGPYARGRLARGWMPPHPAFFARRSVYERLGTFDTAFRIAADYDWLLRVLGAGGVQPAYIPEVLVRMRWGGASNRSLARLLRKSREDLRALRRHRIGGVGALLLKNLSKLPQFV
jgi:glycosyltransferase involved in cell wall biosynthesis